MPRNAPLFGDLKIQGNSMHLFLKHVPDCEKNKVVIEDDGEESDSE